MWFRMMWLLGTVLKVQPEILEEDYVDREQIIRTPFYDAALTYSLACSHVGFENVGGSKCCGSCSYATDCFKYGSCCLNVYMNFTHARDSVTESRYDCVITQYLPHEDSDFTTTKAVWMVTKCDPKFMDTAASELCANPGQQLERVAPVTEPVTNMHFKNRNCAYCNGVGTGTPLINWKLQIHSKRHLSFPDASLLSKIRATRSNIFFIKPEYIKALQCEPVPEYTIDSCNRTGLSIKYNETTKEACDAFVDPFNYTYKNYFCYLCNMATPASLNDMVCPFQSDAPRPAITTPQFVAELDLYTILDKQNQEKLVCKGTQFTDEKLTVCRDVLCHKHRELVNGDCIHSGKVFKEKCFTIFIKMTPVPQTNPPKLVMIEKNLLTREIKFTFRARHAEGHERSVDSANRPDQEFQFFYKETETGFLDYVIVYIQTIFQTSRGKNEFLERLISTQYISAFYRSDNESSFINFVVELAVYNVSRPGMETKVIIPNSETMSVDEIVSDSDGSGTATCLNKETIQFNHLHMCPYIKLATNELSVKTENDFLYISDKDSDRIMKVLSKWNYEEHGDMFNICLDDYLDVYHAITKFQTQSFSTYSSAIGQRFGNLENLCLLVTVCISLLLLLY